MKQLKFLKVALSVVIVGLIVTICVIYKPQEKPQKIESDKNIVLLAGHDHENKLTSIWSNYLAIDHLKDREEKENITYKWFMFDEKIGSITPLRNFK